MTDLAIDVETACEVDLKRHGLDRYVRDPSFRVLMCAWAVDDEPVQIWDATDGSPMPARLRALLLDPEVTIRAFNAEFERGALAHGLKMVIPAIRFECTMIRAFSQSFMGTLGQIGTYVGLPEHLQKDKEGDRLIRIFSMPQKVTKNQPYRWRDSLTDPEDWKLFLGYCKRDVEAERAIYKRLKNYPWPAVEQQYYAMTAAKNDAGIPIDRQFVTNGIAMAARRRDELTIELKALTGLANPNSPAQLTKWLVERGYPFEDINKNTVRKVIAESDEGLCVITHEVRRALKLRQQVARTSPKKFDAILDRAHSDDLMRHAFQFCGASRTNRESGRGAQPHNFPRPPGWLEEEKWLNEVTETVRRGDYEWLTLLAEEPLDAIVGVIRSSFCAPAGYEWVVCDLSSIESVVFGYLSRCEKILDIARERRDPYKMFATDWFRIDYATVSKAQRTLSKPAVLGCAYRLGGGALRDGKRTGLWGYAENMGVQMTQGEAAGAVRVWHETYPEGKQYWFDLENAIMATIRSGNRTKVGCITFDLMKPYLRAQLPSGRFMYYHLPRISIEHGTWPDGSPYAKETISYMGKNQNTGRWERIYSHGGKFAENLTQALAREILYVGAARAHKRGFDIRMKVHDEIAGLRRIGDERFSLARLEADMTDPIDYLPGIPLRADGWVGPFYRK